MLLMLTHGIIGPHHGLGVMGIPGIGIRGAIRPMDGAGTHGHGIHIGHGVGVLHGHGVVLFGDPDGVALHGLQDGDLRRHGVRQRPLVRPDLIIM